MITYPSTHGVFEAAIKDICAAVHEHGAKSIWDGANLNALVGLVRPAELGADVCHMNLAQDILHSHGGGWTWHGTDRRESASGALSAGTCGRGGRESGCRPRPAAGPGFSRALGLGIDPPISWTYIAMMGGEGLTKATIMAIINANYVAKRLAPHFPIVYTGPGGYIAHECIIDPALAQGAHRLERGDVAKRLVDYGYHAPTMSFPVVDTLMIAADRIRGQARTRTASATR